jgi:glutathione S-transferase
MGDAMNNASNDAMSHGQPLELYMASPMWGLPCMSPFGTKLATWLRMTGIPHRTSFEDDPRKGPKRKMPWIVQDGVAMGDSGLIIEHLRRTRAVDPDAHLSARDRAASHLLRRTFEEHFHQIFEHSLFVLDVGWEQARPHFNFLPALPRPLILKLIRKDAVKGSFVRGIGRHTDEEIASMAADDLRAAATVLGEQPYFFGTEPTTVDCTLYGFLATTLWAPIPCAAQQELARHPNLLAFCERMRARYWPELVPQATEAMSSARSNAAARASA